MNEHFVRRMLWGLFIVALGVAFLLNQTGMLTFSISHLFATFWPVILIGIGLQNLLLGRAYGSGSSTWGAIMMILGFIFLGRNLEWFAWSIGEIIRYGWPVILIIVGIKMMFRPSKPRKHQEGEGDWKAYQNPPQPPVMPEDKPVPPAPPLHPDPLLQQFEQRIEAERKEQSGPTAPYGSNGPSHGAPGASGSAGFGGAPGGLGGPGGYGSTKQGSSHGGYGGHRDWKGHMKHKHGHKHGHHERVEWWNHDPGVQTRSGFIGDIHLGSDYWELKPMNISHFIGDTVLDLTKAQIPPGETKITISSFIGDVKVFIPNDYEVGIHVVSSAFLGDASVLERKEGGLFKNMNVETPYYHETDKKIRLVVSTFIGDVRVTKVG